jgi:hypothetical protein
VPEGWRNALRANIHIRCQLGQLRKIAVACCQLLFALAAINAYNMSMPKKKRLRAAGIIGWERVPGNA